MSYATVSVNQKAWWDTDIVSCNHRSIKTSLLANNSLRTVHLCQTFLLVFIQNVSQFIDGLYPGSHPFHSHIVREQTKVNFRNKENESRKNSKFCIHCIQWHMVIDITLWFFYLNRLSRSLWCDNTDPVTATHLIWSWAEDEQVEWDGGHHVYEEPAFEVVDGDLPRVAHHLFIDVYIRGPEVYEDIHDEHDVHDKVHHVEGWAGVATLSPPLLFNVIEEESSRVGGENCCVDDQ